MSESDAKQQEAAVVRAFRPELAAPNRDPRSNRTSPHVKIPFRLGAVSLDA
jgi:hypothetical protein